MATFEVDVEGITYEVDAPDENTAWKWANYTHKNMPKAAEQQAEPSMLDTAKHQAGRTARMLLEGAGDVAGIFGNPIAAITGLKRPSEIASKLATDIGLPENVTPSERISGLMGRGMVGAGTMVGTGQALAKAPGMVGEFGKFMASSPVAQITSAAGGSGAGGMAKEAGANEEMQLLASLAGSMAPTAIKELAPKFGGQVADIIGGLGTHTGGESIRQAVKAGFTGGTKAKAFQDAMRGKSNIADVLDDVRANIAEMGRQKSQLYRSGMVNIKNDKTILSFDDIDDSLAKALTMSTYKGKVVNEDAAKSLQKAFDVIEDWKKASPSQYHTPEGIDALKQSIGGILESIPYEQKTARSAIGGVYNAIKNTINNQAPAYSGVMKNYSDASETIREIERTFSAGNKSSIDQGVRKLQSLLRNNASTNYGNRLALAKQMEVAGGKEILPALAGQSLNTLTPRGLGSAVAGGVGLGGYAIGGPGVAIPALAMQSPRLMGETAYYTGKGAGLLKSLQPVAFDSMEESALRGLLYSGVR